MLIIFLIVKSVMGVLITVYFLKLFILIMFLIVKGSVSDPHSFNPDPDPA